ncbi:hypothetical protein [Halocynthiibacter styelae]|uniref:Uncharacterized protein n=1 Tax=Halocynthiibacter styelae TaxID=2761955 RepID=A0A8J7IVK4_9RHOB|nr:hypothetical protein [Paenihalocynthiibacter styelae]MBI1492385.1 hypothetical protein [Paenihalocynthiibacter styelae]
MTCILPRFISQAVIVLSGALCVLYPASGIAETRAAPPLQCDRMMLLETVDMTLAEPQGPRFYRRQVADAAYLKIRYENMPWENAGAGARDFLEELTSRPDHRDSRVKNIQYSMATTAIGLNATLLLNDVDAEQAMTEAPLDLGRAVILTEGNQRFFDLMRGLIAQSDTQRSVWFDRLMGRQFASVLLDQDETFRLQFAEDAEAAGFYRLAVAVLATVEDTAPIEALISRHSKDALWGPISEGILDDGVLWPLISLRVTSGYDIFDKAVVYNPDGSFQEFREAYEDERYNVNHAVRSSITVQNAMHYSGLVTLLTNSGSPHQLNVHFFREMQAGFESGQINMRANSDAVWLHAWDILRSGLTREEYLHFYPDDQKYIEVLGMTAEPDAHEWTTQLEEILSSMQVPPVLGHFLQGEGGFFDLFDWVQARAISVDYLKGNGEVPVLRPEGISAGFDWDLWTATAQQIAGEQEEGAEMPLAQAKIYAEQLLLKQDVSAALEFIESYAPEPGRETRRWKAAFLRDLARRLDLACDAVLREVPVPHSSFGVYTFPDMSAH